MILALVATMTATAQNLTVSGTLKGLADGTPLELRILSHDDDPAIATATLQNGQFQIKATLSEPVLVGIRPNGNYSGLRMMAAPGDAITVNATLQGRNNGNNIYYEAGDVQISGSSLQATYEEKMSGRAKLDELHGKLQQKWRPMEEKMSKMSKEEQDKVKEGDEYKQMLEEDRQFFRTVEEVYGKAIADNKDTFWGPLLMIMQTSFLTADQIPQYEQFSEAAKNSFYGRKVKDEILPVGGVGSTLLDAGGEYGEHPARLHPPQGRRHPREVQRPHQGQEIPLHRLLGLLVRPLPQGDTQCEGQLREVQGQRLRSRRHLHRHQQSRMAESL